MAKSQSDTAALVVAGDTLSVIRGELDRSPLAPNSRRAYFSALKDFEKWRVGRPMTRTTVQAYLADLQAREPKLSPAHINNRLAAVRWWARRMADLAEEAEGLTPAQRRDIAHLAERAALVKKVPGGSLPRGRLVGEGEIRALLQVCVGDETPAGGRDAAIISLAFTTGMRRSELCGLQVGDVAEIAGGYELTIRRAKGGKDRQVPAYNGARDYLRDWLAIRGDRPGALFLAIRKGKAGLILEHGMGGQSLQEMLGKRAEQAGVVSLGWHDARRTVCSNLLEDGTDLATVQKILGHSSPAVTVKYDRRPVEAQRKALRGVHVPYLRRGEK